MKTAIAWITYSCEGKPEINTYEYATFGQKDADFDNLKSFLDSIKKLARSTGYTLDIKNVVVG